MGAAREVEPPPAQDEEPEDEEAAGEGEPAGGAGAASPWNIMIKHRLVQRRGRRSQMMSSFTDPVVSMDLLRAVLQPSINEEIQAVFSKYMKRARPLEDEVSQQGSPIPRKRKGRPPGQSQPGDRGALGVSTGKTKSCEPVQRDGPKWDPLRLTETTSFVLGSRANKALGMGGTRGRLYIKHPHLFKYAADPQDKHWLAQEQYMRATGGKMAYLLLEEDIQDLAASDEYRSSQDLKLDELKPFTIPSWMIVKMQRYMKTLRSEGEQQLSQQPPPALPEGTRET